MDRQRQEVWCLYTLQDSALSSGDKLNEVLAGGAKLWTRESFCGSERHDPLKVQYGLARIGLFYAAERPEIEPAQNHVTLNP